MKEPRLKHIIHYSASKLRMKVEIRLDDECRNGHADFALTADGREYYNGRWQDSFGGCCHDEILKRYPKLKIFADLHLADSKGSPMYALENAFYHLWDKTKTEQERLKTTKSYLRINEKELKQLAKVNCKDYFHYTIDKLKLPQKWEKEARKAIAKLEQLTGEKWNHSYKWEREQYTPQTPEKRKEVEKRIKEGYYSKSQVKKREEEKRRLNLENKVNKIKESLEKVIKKERTEASLKIWLIKKIYNLTKKDKTKTFIMTEKNIIYYNHAKELCFNWVNYEVQATEENFKKFCESITEKEYHALPQGISFILKQNDKKVLTFSRG